MSGLHSVLRRSLAAVVLTIVTLLAACGQTGPLTLPTDDAATDATGATDGGDAENHDDEDEDER